MFLLVFTANIFCADADVDMLPVEHPMRGGFLESGALSCADSTMVSDLHKVWGLVDMLSPHNGIFLHNTTPLASAENPWRPTDLTRDAFKTALVLYIKQECKGQSVFAATKQFIIEEISTFNSKMFAWEIGMKITTMGFIELLRRHLLREEGLKGIATLIVRANYECKVSIDFLRGWLEERNHVLGDLQVDRLIAELPSQR